MNPINNPALIGLGQIASTIEPSTIEPSPNFATVEELRNVKELPKMRVGAEEVSLPSIPPCDALNDLQSQYLVRLEVLAKSYSFLKADTLLKYQFTQIEQELNRVRTAQKFVQTPNYQSMFKNQRDQYSDAYLAIVAEAAEFAKELDNRDYLEERDELYASIEKAKTQSAQLQDTPADDKVGARGIFSDLAAFLKSVYQKIADLPIEDILSQTERAFSLFEKIRKNAIFGFVAKLFPRIQRWLDLYDEYVKKAGTFSGSPAAAAFFVFKRETLSSQAQTVEALEPILSPQVVAGETSESEPEAQAEDAKPDAPAENAEQGKDQLRIVNEANVIPADVLPGLTIRSENGATFDHNPNRPVENAGAENSEPEASAEDTEPEAPAENSEPEAPAENSEELENPKKGKRSKQPKQ